MIYQKSDVMIDDKYEYFASYERTFRIPERKVYILVQGCNLFALNLFASLFYNKDGECGGILSSVVVYIFFCENLLCKENFQYF